MKANECFILNGSDQAKFTQISEAMPPSRVGKGVGFFALREQLPKASKRVPSKNKASVSFAVSEDKVARNKFSFTQSNLMLR